MSNFSTEVYYPCKIAIIHSPEVLCTDDIIASLSVFKNIKCSTYTVPSIWEIPYVISHLQKPAYQSYTMPDAYLVLGKVDKSTDAYCSVYDALMKAQVDHSKPVVNGLTEDGVEIDVQIITQALLTALITRNKILIDQKFNR